MFLLKKTHWECTEPYQMLRECVCTYPHIRKNASPGEVAVLLVLFQLHFKLLQVEVVLEELPQFGLQHVVQRFSLQPFCGRVQVAEHGRGARLPDVCTSVFSWFSRYIG